MSGAARRLRVAVVFGGRSTEHSISCVSAGSVLAVLDRARYEVVPIGITPEGRWVLEADDPQRLAIRDGRLPSVDGGRTALVLPADPTRGSLAATGEDGRLEDVAFDVVFPLLHGPYGEDGTIQGLLEMAGVPYVGSGVLASAVAMDKEYMKLLLEVRGLPVAPYEVLGEDLTAEARARVVGRARERLTLPVFVKPARGGSSIGITRVDDWADLDAAVAQARRADPKVLVEQGVTPAREVECGVLDGEADGGRPQPSLPAEIRVRGRAFYDFTAKYLDDGGTEFDVPAQLPAELTAEVQRLSVAAFEALGCRGLARVDFFVRPDATLVVNELNTMPGFTPASMFPRMWAASGLDYAALVERLLTTAVRDRGLPAAGSAAPG